MNKKTLLIIGIIVIVIGASVAFLAFRSEDNMEEQPVIDMPSQSSQQNVDSGESTDPSSVQAAGSYVDYSPSVIANTQGTKVLFFHAPWCPQCRELEADIKSQSIPSGVTVIKVDYDSNQALRQKYGVTIQTTLVKVDDNGELVEKYVAYNEPSFAAVKENLL